MPTIGSLAAAAASVAGIEIFEMRLRDATQRGRATETRLRDATQWEAGAELATLVETDSRSSYISRVLYVSLT